LFYYMGKAEESAAEVTRLTAELEDACKNLKRRAQARAEEVAITEPHDRVKVQTNEAVENIMAQAGVDSAKVPTEKMDEIVRGIRGALSKAEAQISEFKSETPNGDTMEADDDDYAPTGVDDPEDPEDASGNIKTNANSTTEYFEMDKPCLTALLPNIAYYTNDDVSNADKIVKFLSDYRAAAGKTANEDTTPKECAPPSRTEKPTTNTSVNNGICNQGTAIGTTQSTNTEQGSQQEVPLPGAGDMEARSNTKRENREDQERGSLPEEGESNAKKPKSAGSQGSCTGDQNSAGSAGADAVNIGEPIPEAGAPPTPVQHVPQDVALLPPPPFEHDSDSSSQPRSRSPVESRKLGTTKQKQDQREQIQEEEHLPKNVLTNSGANLTRQRGKFKPQV
jgi:hypothetical protein